MNILINFSSLKAGGGQTVAMNFLLGFVQANITGVNLFFLVARDSEPHKYLQEIDYSGVIVASRNPYKRIANEIIFGRKWIAKFEIDVVYSYFGYALFPKSVIQVSGSADSNLYFPELNFWRDYSRIRRLGKMLVDRYRLFGIRRANAVVFENPAMLARAKMLYGLKNTKYIRPSINFKEITVEATVPKGVKTNYPMGLFLCGWHLNKNVLRIPELASEMLRRGSPMCFIITASMDDSPISREFQRAVDTYDVNDYVHATGAVDKSQLPALYASSDIVFLLSKLESFSNNILEAWFFRKPLIVSDEVWSHELCKDAVLYADRTSVAKIADRIQEVLGSKECRNQIICNGDMELSSYPSISERIAEEMVFVKEVYESA